MVTQSGVYHESYRADMQLRPTSWQRYRLAFVLVVVLLLPIVAGVRELRIVNTVLIASIGAIGLNILVGYTGQISLGQGAFLAVGAYSTGLLMIYYDLPWPIACLLAGFITAAFGAVFGIPSLRLKGLYLAVATLAAQEIVSWGVRVLDFIDGKDDDQARELAMPVINFVGTRINATGMSSERSFYVVAMGILIVTVILVTNLFRTHIGRAFIAIRDQDIAAEVMGVNVFFYKLLAFATSSFFVGIAGALTAIHSTNLTFERFTIEVSIEYLAMIIIGGLGSVSGSIYGAIFIKILPEILQDIGESFSGAGLISANDLNQFMPSIEQVAFGLAIILTLVFEPEGIKKLWADTKAYFRLWPFSY
ncbi:MAG: branched-chain amino acid ABC transporter permease [Phototrophicales bacterium]|nr:MAG: branched-chain amino acid ABC transporter permease [Phototrophicales bacterium]